MANVGGDFLEVTCNHPTLGSFTFLPKSGEAGSLDLGGLSVDDSEDGITGNGEAIYLVTNGRWKFEVVCALSTTLREDTANIKALQQSGVEGEWTFQHASGAIYGGKGMPVGRYTGDAGAATFPLVVGGGGDLRRIA